VVILEFFYIRLTVATMSYYKNISDHELTTLLNESDERAFCEIYMRYHSLLLIYVNKKLLNKQESEDIIQEVMTSLWKNRFDFYIQTSLASYLYTAARNRCLDVFAHRKVESKYITSLQNFIQENVNRTDYLIRENDLKALIAKEVALLPPKMREIFLLSRSQSMSHREIADILAISEHTVSTQIKRALRRLRIRLGLFTWLYMIICDRFFF
jgi:RNA polymerase sigma-70 factor (family 1)